MMEQPYFMKNEDWYTLNPNKNSSKPHYRTWILTDKAPAEARKSYKEFYKQLDWAEDNLICL